MVARLLVPALVFCACIMLHFRGLLMVPWDEFVWGISLAGDPVGVIADYWSRFLQAEASCPNVIRYESFPFGETTPDYWRFLVEPQAIMLDVLFRVTGSPFSAYNSAVLFSYLVNFVLIYLVAQRWASHWYIALIPAVLITFSVYGFAHSFAHLGLMLFSCIPVFYILLSDYLESPTSALSIVLGVIVGLSLYISPYYFYMLFWIGLILLAYRYYRRKVSAATWRNALPGALAMILLMVPFLHDQFMVNHDGLWRDTEVQRSFGDDLVQISAYSARPSDYVVSNIHHVALGDWFKGLITDVSRYRHSRSDELPIALGLTVIAFLAYLFLAAILPSELKQRAAATWRPAADLFARRDLIVPALITIVVAFLLSLAPRLEYAGLTLYTPNEVLRELIPFRSYSRFAIVVLSISALLLMIAVGRSQRPHFWTACILLVGSLEVMPSTYLHPTHKNWPYIDFLKARSEKSIMYFEEQNLALQQQVRFDAILTEKMAVNGWVNYHFLMTEFLLQNRPPGFHAGHLGDMGVDLLMVHGGAGFPPVDQPYLERLGYFEQSMMEIWKIKPSGDPELTRIMGESVKGRYRDSCHVTTKPAASAKIVEMLKHLASQRAGPGG